MKKIVLILLMAVAVTIILGCSRQKINVTINVIPPPSTPPDAQLYITGNHEEAGNWDPGLIILKKVSDSLWSVTVQLQPEFYFEFKITRGSWNKQAIYRYGEIPSNTTLTVLHDTSVTLNPVDWQDLSYKAAGGIVGNVKYHGPFIGDGLKYARDIIVWLPPSYVDAETRRYPVLYMHDGQNIIDPSTSFIGYDWHADEVSDSLIRSGKMKDIIIVGIYNTPDRSEEYNATELGHAYMKFMVNILKPFVDSTYRTISRREATATMGSSMGGLISFLLVWYYPDVFSTAGCLSPAFMGGIIDEVYNYNGPDKNIRIYMDNGGVGLEERLQIGCENMLNALRIKGFVDGKNLMWYNDPSAEHNERAWASRLWRPFLFLFAK